MGKILEIHDLKVCFHTEDGTVHALNNVDLTLEDGITLGLVGETGAGKTTLAKSIMRLIPSPPGKIENGEIIYDGKNILELSDTDIMSIRGQEISMIFQDPMSSLNPVITVGDQIAEVIQVHNKDLDKKEVFNRACEMLEMVGISADRAFDYPHQFSGGMKQRVVIAMALACNPELLIADEPTTALDVTIQAQVLEMMKGLRDKYNTSMLMITHDLGIVAEICDKVSVVYAGRVIEHGTLEDIFENTRHPYTEGLFNSLPNLEDRQAQLKPIKGLMPDPSNLPKGCAFCPRCDYAMEICKTEKPKRVYRNETHYVECHLYNKDNIQEGKVGKR